MHVNQPVVRSGFEVLTRVFVDVRRAKDAVDPALGGKRDGAADGRLSRLRGFDNLVARSSHVPDLERF